VPPNNGLQSDAPQAAILTSYDVPSRGVRSSNGGSFARKAGKADTIKMLTTRLGAKRYFIFDHDRRSHIVTLGIFGCRLKIENRQPSINNHLIL
jgi:hypothetical protein